MQKETHFQNIAQELLAQHEDEPQLRTALIDALYRLEQVETLLDRPEQQNQYFATRYREAVKQLRIAVDVCPED